MSSLDMAQYVFWTGDEEGVARAVEEFIQKGLMSRDNAIKLLREISMGIEYLENSYSNRVAAAASVATKDNDIMQEDSAMVILFFFSSFHLCINNVKCMYAPEPPHVTSPFVHGVDTEYDAKHSTGYSSHHNSANNDDNNNAYPLDNNYRHHVRPNG